MMSLIYLSLCVLLSNYAIPGGLTCGDNESEVSCPKTCTYDNCPESADEANECISDDNCVPACKCRFNYRRAKNGTCIPTRDCPPFDCSGENEVYNPCPPLCSDNCGSVNDEGVCQGVGRIGIILECKPKCRCASGYGRKNGVCITNEECSEDCEN
ncbi:inducible metalloproteinase inhibitor protein-like [Aphomia sociella]